MTKRATLWTSAALLLAMLMLGGCARLFPRKEPPPPPETLSFSTTAEELALELADLQLFAAERLTNAGDEILGVSTDAKVREAATLLRTSVIEQLQLHVNQPEPGTALLDTWSYIARIHHYLTEGDGKNAFGRHQPIAVAAAEEVLTRARGLAAQHLPPDRMVELDKEISEFIKENPLKGAFAETQPTRFSLEARGRRALGFLTGLPFAPVKAATSTVNPVSSISDSANRFSDVVEKLPEDVRIQLEMLATNLQDNDALTSALVSLNTFSNSTDRISTSLDQLPQDMQQLMQQLERTQPELQRTLAETNNVMQSTNEATVNMQGVARESTLLVQEAHATAAALQGVIETANALAVETQNLVRMLDKETTGTEENERPFDILEYKATLESAQVTLQELRATLADVERIASSDVLETNLQAVNDQANASMQLADERLRGVIDYLIVRLVVLAVIITMLAVIYRVFAHLLAMRVARATK